MGAECSVHLISDFVPQSTWYSAERKMHERVVESYADCQLQRVQCFQSWYPQTFLNFRICQNVESNHLEAYTNRFWISNFEFADLKFARKLQAFLEASSLIVRRMQTLIWNPQSFLKFDDTWSLANWEFYNRFCRRHFPIKHWVLRIPTAHYLGSARKS